MLLDGISRDWIVQQEREIGIQIEQRSADECIGFECVAARTVEPIVQRRRAGANTAAVSPLGSGCKASPGRERPSGSDHDWTRPSVRQAVNDLLSEEKPTASIGRPPAAWPLSSLGFLSRSWSS